MISVSLFINLGFSSGDDPGLLEHVVSQAGDMRGVIDADRHFSGASKQIRKTALQKPLEIRKLLGPHQALRGLIQELSLACIVVGGKFGVRLQSFLPRLFVDRGFIFRGERKFKSEAAANA